MASVRGDVCAERRSRRPMVSIKVTTSKVRPTYAPRMDPIAPDRLLTVLSRGDDCSLGKAVAGIEKRI